MSADEIFLLQVPLRAIFIVLNVTSWGDVRFWDLPLKGVFLTILTTLASVMAGFQYQGALKSGGSGSIVAAVVGTYPALAYFVGLLLGLESVSLYKLMGVFFACLSCLMFCL